MYVKVKLSNSVLTVWVKSVKSEHGVIVATALMRLFLWLLFIVVLLSMLSSRGEAGQRPGI